MLVEIGKSRFEIAGSLEALFVNIGRLEIVIQRDAYKPSKWLEVWKEPQSITETTYNSPHYFALGRRLFWSRTQPSKGSSGVKSERLF